MNCSEICNISQLFSISPGPSKYPRIYENNNFFKKSCKVAPRPRQSLMKTKTKTKPNVTYWQVEKCFLKIFWTAPHPWRTHFKILCFRWHWVAMFGFIYQEVLQEVWPAMTSGEESVMNWNVWFCPESHYKSCGILRAGPPCWWLNVLEVTGCVARAYNL